LRSGTSQLSQIAYLYYNQTRPASRSARASASSEARRHVRV